MAEPAGCPHCGLEAVAGPECPRCGIVLAKARPRPEPPAPRGPNAPEPGRADRGWWHFPLALIALAAGALWLLDRGASAPASGGRPHPPRRTASRPGPPAVAAAASPTPGAPSEEADAAAAEAEAPSLEPRLAFVPPPGQTGPDPEGAAIERLLRRQDWAGAEAAARVLLEREPRSPAACQALGLSLYRQDRLRDALEAARECGDAGLERQLEARLAAGAGFSEHQVSHFHVRYDGEAYEEISRDVIQALDAGYAKLVGELGFEPRRPIPVDLLSREDYVEETGKTWTAGQYTHGDGRIRVKVRGLTVTPAFEETLLHELCHAFLGDLTGGRTPREINEGLAQYVTGRRVGWQATDPRDAARYPWKPFYDDALSFTEYLVGQRGVRGVVEALTRLGETGNADASFREVFGDDLRELGRRWSARRRQLAGG